jgi:diguanylate cyclase
MSSGVLQLARVESVLSQLSSSLATSDADPGDDELVFADEQAGADDDAASALTPVRRWRILVVDDDREVHTATAFALRGAEIDGIELELLHAGSAGEAEAMLRQEQGIAVALIDVVMETPDAGLRLVSCIRQELGLHNLRIILRTGQPGYAPELEVIRQSDINDYRTKSELTQARLLTALTAAIRAYAQLEGNAQISRGMARVVQAAQRMASVRVPQAFGAELLRQLAVVLECDSDGAFCAAEANAEGAAPLRVLEASGRYEHCRGEAVAQLCEPQLRSMIERCALERCSLFDESRAYLWLGNERQAAVAVFHTGGVLDELTRRLLELMAANIAVALGNVMLFEQLDFHASFDALTRLPNRARFLADVDHDLFSHADIPRCMAIVDVVRFSDINDALGHRCGDSLLSAVARRLCAVAGAHVLCARIAGDVFALFGPTQYIDPLSIRRAFDAPFYVQGHVLSVSLRVGLAQVAESHGGAVELLRSANLAVNQVRSSGGSGHSHFVRAMSDDVQTRVSMLHGLRAAIDFKRGLSLVYQPQVNARDGELVGVEALLRWRNDAARLVPPNEFIPLAERTGLINELGLWVLDAALARQAKWRAQGRALSMSVNVSSVQFRSEDFARRVLRLIEHHAVDPASVVLEITESIALEDHAQVSGQIEELRRVGVHFAIDDFGTGFSSLSQIARLPADQLKIDRSFVEKLGIESESARADHAMAATVVMLAAARSMSLMAEGVESAAQRDALIEMGCEKMQGYFFGHPMPAEQFEAWLVARLQG